MSATRFLIALKTTLFLTAGALSAQHVGINTTSPDPSSALDIQSSEKGLLIPRMTRNQRNLISSPATGLLVFQTDEASGFYFFNGSGWTSLNGSNGTNGQGLPAGGSAGQVLAKADGTDYNTQWITPVGGAFSPATQLDVSQTSGQDLTTVNTNIKLQWGAPATNLANQFDTGTETFTAAADGLYYIAAACEASGTSGAYAVRILVNGVKMTNDYTTILGEPLYTTSTLLTFLKATDTVSIEYRKNAAAAAITSTGNGYFRIIKLK